MADRTDILLVLGDFSTINGYPAFTYPALGTSYSSIPVSSMYIINFSY